MGLYALPPWPVPHMEPHAEILGVNGFTAPTGPTYPPHPPPSAQQQLSSLSDLPHPPQPGLRKVNSEPVQPHPLPQDHQELYSLLSTPLACGIPTPLPPLMMLASLFSRTSLVGWSRWTSSQLTSQLLRPSIGLTIQRARSWNEPSTCDYGS